MAHQFVDSSAISSSPGPVADAQRLVILDILRGFALWGILLMNIEWFNRPISEIGQWDESQQGLSLAAGWFVRLFIEGKFYTLFSLLFGMGFAIMLRHGKATGRDYFAWFSRRLTVLFLFGLLHLVFLWSGDILHSYAMAGFILLGMVWLFDKGYLQDLQRPHNQLRVALWWLGAPSVLLLLAALLFSTQDTGNQHEQDWQYEQAVEARAKLLMSGAKPLPVDENSTELSEPELLELDARLRAEELKQNALELEQEIQALGQGTFLQASKFRLQQATAEFPFSLINILLAIFPLFLLGYALQGSGMIENYQRYSRVWKLLCCGGIGIGLPLSLWALILMQAPRFELDSWLGAVAYSLYYLSQYVLSAGYLGGLLWLCSQPRWLARLSGLAAMGKMALTHYLTHSLVLSLLFFGYGLGWYGQVDRAWQLLIALALLICQLLISPWWLTYFQFGPLEWLWRCLTYKAWQPFRRVKPAMD
ncbi:DUF418 domain-containing protein [Bowmanella sp. Y26]|uniref:DUF418 domain-containing protein n=1 Tax=Bowmanella yangjiangensis TaxID=2811230 RepID=UPI001BDC78D8|nr:DUF418 domain-containing protein [Bowmanella yangjiangensis]MBT1065551.1 DUF418 domain-containing protein [Bowmanella yangjiangensis]